MFPVGGKVYCSSAAMATPVPVFLRDWAQQGTSLEGRQEAVKRVLANYQQQATELDLSGLNLDELPPIADLLGHVLVYRAEHNQLTTWPYTATQLPKLRRLFLAHNRLSTLPESLGEWQQLTHLDLCYNQLRALPNNLEPLQALRQLSLSNNNLYSLPESISKLHLQRFDISGNRDLCSLPLSLRHMLVQMANGNHVEWQIELADTPWYGAVQYQQARVQHLRRRCDNWHRFLPEPLQQQVAQQWQSIRNTFGAVHFADLMADLPSTADYSRRPEMVIEQFNDLWRMLCADGGVRQMLFKQIPQQLDYGDHTAVLFQSMLLVVRVEEAVSKYMHDRQQLLRLGKRLLHHTVLEEWLGRNYPDSISYQRSAIILQHWSFLEKPLDLLTHVESLLYPGNGPITPQQLNDALSFVKTYCADQQNLVDFLLDQKFWRRHLAQNYGHENDNEPLHDALEAAAEQHNEEAYRQKSLQLKEHYREQKKQFYRQKTLSLLAAEQAANQEVGAIASAMPNVMV